WFADIRSFCRRTCPSESLGCPQYSTNEPWSVDCRISSISNAVLARAHLTSNLAPFSSGERVPSRPAGAFISPASSPAAKIAPPQGEGPILLRSRGHDCFAPSVLLRSSELRSCGEPDRASETRGREGRKIDALRAESISEDVLARAASPPDGRL